MKKCLLILLVSSLLFGCAQETTTQNKTNNDEIVIGGIAPLSGAAANYGMPIQRVANLVVSDINSNGGINGNPLKIIWEDTKCNSKEAALSAQKLIGASGVKVIIGEACTGSAMAIDPITSKKDVVVFLTGTTGEVVRDTSDWMLRVSPSGVRHSELIADFAERQGWDKIATLTQQTDFALSIEQTLIDLFDGEVQSEKFLGEETDFKVRITKLKADDEIDALFINPQTIDRFSVIYKQLLEQGFDKPLIFNEIIAGDVGYTLEHRALLDQYSAPMWGAKFSFHHIPGYDEFYARYLEYYDLETELAPIFIATTYDGVNILADILRSLEDPYDSEAIRSKIAALKDYKGLSGEISLDKDGQVVGIESTLVRYNDGAFRAVK